MNDQNLVELVRLSRNGNSQAVEKLVKSCQPTAFRLALSILDDPDEADDVAQDALIQTIRAIPSYRAEATFQTWFYRIIVNNCLGKLRKRRARERLSRLLNDLFRREPREVAPPEQQTIQNESTDRIIGVINDLDLKYRLPIVLRYYQELPIAQIAEILNVSSRTVNTRLKLAHDMIRKSLGEIDGID
jgi:RNA polymerase sigma-70 factor (ECF subfamily)